MPSGSARYMPQDRLLIRELNMTDQKRPNILWISFEDTNPFYGCYGDPVARTPNVDRLAAEGCRWPLCFSTTGVCAPTRSAVITGMYPISIGAHHMRTTHINAATPELPTPYSAVIPPHVKCFSEYMRAAGYYCTNNQKTDYQFAAPSTAWHECGPDGHWRNRTDPDQPFFAVFNPTTTHESGMWPENCPEPTFDPADMRVPPTFPDTPKVREALARMYTNIEKNDQVMGNLLRQLEEDGLTDNTIVFHWSDHGPLPRGKRWPYDSGIHVPMIVRWPGGLEPGSVSDRLVSTIDLAPTVLSLTGIEIPWHMQGQAFLGAQTAPPREYVYATRDRYDEAYDRIRAVRDKRFKYMRNYCPELPYLLWIPYRNRHPIVQEMWRCYMAGELTQEQKLMFQQKRPVEELYDTQNDPHETRNLAYDPVYVAERTRLRKALDAWLEKVGDMGAIPETEMVRQWYPNGEQPQTAAPVFVPIEADNYGVLVTDGGALRVPCLLQLHCASQGASMEYRLDDQNGWTLYTGPFSLAPGERRIQARAIRIGYQPSEEREIVLQVTAKP